LTTIVGTRLSKSVPTQTDCALINVYYAVNYEQLSAAVLV